MPRPGMAATARQWLVDFGLIKPATPQRRLRAERTVPLAPAPERAPELSPDGDNDAPVAEPTPAPLVEHQAPVADTTPDTTSTALVTTAAPEPAAATASPAEPAPKPRGRFLAWLREVFGIGASSPNDPLRLLAALSVAAVTGVISYDTLAALGAGMGFGEPGSHLFPIGIDAAVFLFTRAWMNRRLSKETRASARRTALFFMAASVFGNAIQHGKHTYDVWVVNKAAARALHQTWTPGVMDVVWLVVTIVFSALMPLALGKSLHLMAQVADDNRRLRDEKAKATEAPPVQEPAKPHRRPKKKPKPTDVPDDKTTAPKPDVEPADGAHVIELNQHTERPEWLTEELAATAKKAMFAYLDRRPEASGVELDRFGIRWLNTSPNYGRGVRRDWLKERGIDSSTDAVAAGKG